jgi:hypothetical protein
MDSALTPVRVPRLAGDPDSPYAPGESGHGDRSPMNARALRSLVPLAAVLGGVVLAGTLAHGGGQTQYDSGDPTPAEQQVLEIINRARANPTAEGQRLHIDINEGLSAGQTATPHPPLAMNKILLGTARAHSQDMYARKYFDHVDPDGHDPYQRMTTAGRSSAFSCRRRRGRCLNNRWRSGLPGKSVLTRMPGSWRPRTAPDGTFSIL